MSLKATQAYRKTPKGLATNLYNKIKERSAMRGWVVPFSLAAFQQWFMQQDDLKYLMFAWRKNNYKSPWRPSVDRIDCKKPYSFSNMRLITWMANREKGDFENSQVTTEVIQLSMSGKIISVYSSIKEAVKETGCHQGLISACCQGKRNNTSGFKWRYGRTFRKKPESIANQYEHPHLLEGK
ncbi:MAG TPA: hypothetical protein V6D12_14040 [Candidatus Obscuribacterales bacterium]